MAVSTALALCYGFDLGIPYLSPIFAVLLAIGLTVIPAAGILSPARAGAIVEAMVFGMAVELRFFTGWVLLVSLLERISRSKEIACKDSFGYMVI
ncbi:hypothetical protein [Microbulbifer agarilyticus]|uniref:hypothetical protein n=1 Tax=Microbulbifer agarilyticus TaxID=260552 RepID=UPI001CD431A8|nr:hypothetical protein [Microbulbifer agarilyticus]MCA0899896.1 hypothetical protein [Microbulbifer agarilyticus]